MGTGLHEDFHRDYAVEAASNKRFGLIVGAIALAFGIIRASLHGEIGIVAGAMGAIGLALIATALIKADLLESLNRGWGKLGHLLHKITNPVILGVMYVGAILPTALVMRLFGTDPMGQRRKPDGTYWISRNKAGSTSESLQRPF